MQIVIASAKIMNNRAKKDMAMTPILFRSQTEKIALDMMQRSTDELMDIFHTTPRVAQTAWRYYQSFLDPTTEKMPAIMAYNGQVYKYLSASTLSPSALEFAEHHLMIVTALFGLLRPSDGIRPYRMEGQIMLHTDPPILTFDLWQPLLTPYLIEQVKNDDGILINLFPEEFKRIFFWKDIEREVRVVQPLFKVKRGGKLRTIVVHAKTCRGAMARYILENKISNPDDLKGFQFMNYTYAPEYSTDDEWVFVRPE